MRADVGAYFGGKNFGRRKLSEVSSAAGSASPNKTVEGALTGFLCCSLLSMLGAYVMRWPAWAASGALYGLVMSVLGLVGDLTASVMKRDAGVKDTGSLLPGHGGLLDRFDSYLLSAPVAYFFVRHVLPWIERVVRVGR
jgi:phosphatidate cytidylyltransferase